MQKESIQWGNCVLSALIGVILTIVVDHLFSVKPAIEEIAKDISAISKAEEATQNKISIIEEKYLQKDNEGISCKVGVSSELIKNQVSVFKNNQFDLKSQDVVYITNPFGPFTPTAAFIVSMVDGADSKSDADLFLSKEGLEKLDISRADFKKGVFDMKLRLKDKRKYEELRKNDAAATED